MNTNYATCFIPDKKQFTKYYNFSVTAMIKHAFTNVSVLNVLNVLNSLSETSWYRSKTKDLKPTVKKYKKIFVAKSRVTQ